MKFKALSFRQPWADLILTGKKTLDLRTWSSKYRGPLAIYASMSIEKDACLENGLDPQTLSTGVVIGIVDLVDIIQLDQVSYETRQSEHLAGRPYKPGLFGWVLKNPHLVEPPVVVKGRLHLFDVDIPASEEISRTVNQDPMPAISASMTKSLTSTGLSSEFELRVLPETEKGYRLELTQKLAGSANDQSFKYQQTTNNNRLCVQIGGDHLRAVADVVLETLRQNGYKPTDLGPARREPFHLDEQSGVRLGLVLLAARLIRKVNRIDAISNGIRQMTKEELYYWYSKCTSGPKAERAQMALRVLLSDE